MPQLTKRKRNSLFQLTRLMRGVTGAEKVVTNVQGISTHTPHARRDHFNAGVACFLKLFQLTRLMRGVTFLILGSITAL